MVGAIIIASHHHTNHTHDALALCYVNIHSASVPEVGIRNDMTGIEALYWLSQGTRGSTCTPVSRGVWSDWCSESIPDIYRKGLTV